MKYFKTYEGFKKDYMKKIDLKDFKKIKKGSKIMYMGGEVEVLDNNGFVLKLKGNDGKIFSVNKSMFDHGGMIKEGKGFKINLKADHLSSEEYQKAKKLKDFDKEDWKWNSKSGLYDKVNEAKRGTVFRAAKKGSYPISLVVVKNGKVIDQELVNTPEAVPAAFNVIQDKHKGAIVHIEDNTGKRLFTESLHKPVNEMSSEKDGTEASNGKHKHEDHLEEDLEAMWKKVYGEKFSSKYPAVAKIIKQRQIKDKREIARIWDETYGENFEEEYPGLWDKLK